MPEQSTSCAPFVKHYPGTRYPYVPACPCGWHGRGYLREHAAQTMVEAHRDGEPGAVLVAP